MNIFFWNVQQKDLTDVVVEIISELNIEICCLAESNLINDEKILACGMNNIARLSNLKVFTKLKGNVLNVIEEGSRHCSVKFSSPITEGVIITFCHLLDKRNSSPTTKILEINSLMANINAKKISENIVNIIIIGDMNQNPYDEGIIAAGCLHATNNRKIAKKGSRTVQGELYDYFYNPMWQFYGQRNEPHGTYYLSSSDRSVINWNILDQVIFSSSLLDKIGDGDVRIISQTRSHKFLNKKGFIDKSIYSDHLPISLNANI